LRRRRECASCRKTNRILVEKPTAEGDHAGNESNRGKGDGYFIAGGEKDENDSKECEWCEEKEYLDESLRKAHLEEECGHGRQPSNGVGDEYDEQKVKSRRMASGRSTAASTF